MGIVVLPVDDRGAKTVTIVHVGRDGKEHVSQTVGVAPVGPELDKLIEKANKRLSELETSKSQSLGKSGTKFGGDVAAEGLFRMIGTSLIFVGRGLVTLIKGIIP